MKFMANVWAAFLARVNPVSTMAKPACMNITKNPVMSVHTKLIATVFAAAAALAARASESVASAAGAAGIPCAPSASGPARLKRVARANALFMSFSCPRVNRLQQPACHMICV